MLDTHFSSVSPAIWPKNRELQFHLQYRPWLILPFAVDAAACYEEAHSLLNEFVEHRPYDQQGVGKWKSLALRSVGGKKENTEGKENYLSGEYSFTEIWNLCPVTANFLRHITDVDQCERIRFMLLEPGAEISVHNDAPMKHYSPAVNIALNMPEGCEFWVDLNKDGTTNRYSSKIPLKDGSVFLFNSANYHCVKNHSKVARIHIIFHGPLRISENSFLKLAREQNAIEGPHAAFKTVLNKQVELGGRELAPEELADLFHLGVRPDSLPDFVGLGILQSTAEDPLLQAEATQITEGSLHPLPGEIVPLPYLESWLKKKLDQQKEFAVLLAAGTFLDSSHLFWVENMKLIAQMIHKKIPLVGHLMNKEGHLPYLHPQFFLLHLPSWKEAGCPNFFSEQKEVEFPKFKVSVENIHSDYTPLWIEADLAKECHRGGSGFGTQVLSEFLFKDLTVKNVPHELRLIKTYGYPEAGRGEHWDSLWKKVKAFTVGSESRVYPFNTERLLVRDYRLQPELLLSPCAGIKPLALYRQLLGKRSSMKISFIEMNPLAIAFYERVLDCKNLLQLHAVLLEEVKKDAGSFDGVKEYTQKMIDSALIEGFGQSESEFFRMIDLVSRNATFHKWNYFSDQEKIVSLLAEQSFFFWHSNAWQTNAAMCTYGALHLRQNYRALVAKAQEKLGCPAFTHRNIFEAVFGEDFYSPRGVFTMGGKKKESPKVGAFEIFNDVGMKILNS
jgi:hypothetical protein